MRLLKQLVPVAVQWSERRAPAGAAGLLGFIPFRRRSTAALAR